MKAWQSNHTIQSRESHRVAIGSSVCIDAWATVDASLLRPRQPGTSVDFSNKNAEIVLLQWSTWYHG